MLLHRPSQPRLGRPCVCITIQFRTSWHCVTRWTFSSQLFDPCVSVARKAARSPGVMANALHVGAPGTRSTSLVAVRLSPLCAHTTSFSTSVEEMPARNPPLIWQRSAARQIDSFEHHVSQHVPELIHVLRGLCMLQLGSLLLLAWMRQQSARITPAGGSQISVKRHTQTRPSCQHKRAPNQLLDSTFQWFSDISFLVSLRAETRLVRILVHCAVSATQCFAHSWLRRTVG